MPGLIFLFRDWKSGSRKCSIPKSGIPVLNFIFRTGKAIPIAGRSENPEILEKAYRRMRGVLEDEYGTVMGALVRHRWTVGHCTAYPVLIDHAAAPTLGAMIEHSSVTDVAGMESDTAPLQPHMLRWDTVSRATPASLPSGFSWDDNAPNVRRANRADLSDLVEVVWRYSPHAFANPWLLRRRSLRVSGPVAQGSRVGQDRAVPGRKDGDRLG